MKSRRNFRFLRGELVWASARGRALALAAMAFAVTPVAAQHATDEQQRAALEELRRGLAERQLPPAAYEAEPIPEWAVPAGAKPEVIAPPPAAAEPYIQPADPAPPAPAQIATPDPEIVEPAPAETATPDAEIVEPTPPPVAAPKTAAPKDPPKKKNSKPAAAKATKPRTKQARSADDTVKSGRAAIKETGPKPPVPSRRLDDPKPLLPPPAPAPMLPPSLRP